jgi:NHLM bacteriocin system ABC transporter ATP-binding protein
MTAPTLDDVERAFPLHMLAQTEERGGHEPILLTDASLWWVTRGAVDLFTVPLAAAGGGARVHLTRVTAGEPLFGFAQAGPTGRGVIGVPLAGTQLLRATQADLRTLAADGGLTPAVRGVVERWIHVVCRSLVDKVLPQRSAELPAAGESHTEEAATVRIADGITWITHLEGHSFLFGRPSLVVNGTGFTPLTHDVWLARDAGNRILSLAPDAVQDAVTVFDGVANLHRLVLQHDAERDVERRAAAVDRLTKRSAVGASALAHACSSLASAVDPTVDVNKSSRRHGHGAPADPTTYEEAVLAAVRLVGDALDLEIQARPSHERLAAGRDPLQPILRASRVRARAVALRGEWWTTDAGPMLAYLESDRRPLALLPTAKRGYTAHDVIRNTRVPVTAELASQLIPFAQTLYRPFPDVPLGMKEILRFGFHRSGRDLLVLLVMGLGTAVLGMVPSIATGILFNTAIPSAMRDQVVQVMFVLMVCALTTAAFNIVRGLAVLRIEGRMGAAVQAAVWDRLLALPLPFFRQFTAGELASRAMSIDSIRQAISGATVNAVMGGIFSIGNVVLMFWYSPGLAWRGLALIGIAVTVTMIGSWLQLRPSRDVLTLQSKTSGVVLQLLSSVSKLRVAAAESRAFQQWALRFSRQRAIQFRVRRIGNVVQAFNAAYPTLAYIWIFFTAVPLIATRGSGLGTGDFLAFLSAFSSSLTALLGTSLAMLSIFNTIPMYEAARPILAAEPEVTGSKADPGTLSGQIEIHHAHFRYGAAGPTVLRDVTLSIAPGEFVAFVGPSGSGKSTLLRLLLGFERLESGAIYYDGQDLANLDVQAVRRQLGVVLQSGRLMSGDIFTNISGSATIAMDDAWDAARMAGLDDDIKAMPMGMHTVISEGGGTLSGGQRQRLLIARAIVHRPRILFFDEATSALDNRTQAIVSRSLETLQATRIVVAHRLSTIVNADRIVVIDRGQIVQEGRYHDLVSQPGLFRDLALRQIV